MARKYSYKPVAVFGSNNLYLSHCTLNRASKLISSGRAVRRDANSIQLRQSKKERIAQKHIIIRAANRVCYICGRRIPEDETATIDHIIPKSRDSRADIYTNMRCCCERCNNDKGNKKLSEYVRHIDNNRRNYSYLKNKQIKYLREFAHYYEREFYRNIYLESLQKKGNVYS